MFTFGQRESRKFIDLLLQVTNNKWTNMDVNKEVKVGDFGRLDRATGELLIEGNLYEHPDTRAVMEDYPVKTTAPVDIERYTSGGVREIGLSPSVDIGFQNLAEAGFEGKWEFKNSRGALLILLLPRIHSMQGFPTGTILEKRFKSLLKGRAICTDVVSCPAFFLYLGKSKDHLFELSLKVDVPIASAVPGLTVGGGIGTKWKAGGAQGILKQGFNDKGEHVFFPLYSLKGISWGRVGSISRSAGPVDEASVLEDAETPWIELDDDGEELDFPIDSDEPV
ncbi:hypothetical protein GYMLUDRAFT_86419 [Collybiopsis luxurians FD-317 M1]|uniref:Uncharacterized protein n=1 Tax=Collybiopsis luxurians FD-317 M1 TaxID=944289 RepID=A0A0D0C688_9AGAR|nr:hypothetical protein GYMLUDRAFT_86419 [Collybiopsis luxurians FD-317 M1]